MLLEAGFEGAVDHLLDAVPRGYAGVIPYYGDGGATITKFDLIHPTNIVFDMEGNPAIISPTRAEPIPAGNYHPLTFCFHYFRRYPGIPALTGLGRNLSWLFFFKRLARKSWSRFLEKFGIPFLVAKISEADFANEALKKKLIGQLRNFASDGAILTTEEGGVEAVTVAGHHNRIHEEFVKEINVCFAIAILGQLGSSEGEPGRLGNNQSQDAVRQDKVKADARAIMETLNRGIIRPLWLFREGSPADCPTLAIDYVSPGDLKDRAETVKLLREAGYVVSRQQVSYDFKMELEAVTEPLGAAEGDGDE